MSGDKGESDVTMTSRLHIGYSIFVYGCTCVEVSWATYSYLNLLYKYTHVLLTLNENTLVIFQVFVSSTLNLFNTYLFNALYLC